MTAEPNEALIQRGPASRSSVETFNQAHPIGTPVRYWPGTRDGEGARSITRSPAWSISGHAVVSVEGYAGGIALSHIDVLSGRS